MSNLDKLDKSVDSLRTSVNELEGSMIKFWEVVRLLDAAQAKRAARRKSAAGSKNANSQDA